MSTDVDNARSGDYWWFYCYLCEQWCERAGPWCDVYRSGPFVDACIFDENPGWSIGVRRDQDPDTERQLPFYTLNSDAGPR